MSQRFNDQELEALFHKNLPQDPIPVALSNRIKQEVLAEVNATLRESAQTRGAYSSARDGNWLNRIFGGLPKIQIGPSMVMAGTMAVAILLIVVNIPSIVSMLNLDAPTPVSGDVVHPDSSPTPTLTMQVAISVTNTVATTIAPTESPTHTKIATESPTATPSPTTTETPTATLTESKKAEDTDSTDGDASIQTGRVQTDNSPLNPTSPTSTPTVQATPTRTATQPQ